MSKLCFYLTLLFCCGWAFGQDAVQWTATLSTSRCNVGDQVVLELKLTGAESNPLEPTLPDIPGVGIEFAGASKNLQFVNGVTSSSSSFTYILTPTTTGTVTIPAIPTSVNGVSYATEPLQLQVGTSSGLPPQGGPPAQTAPTNPFSFPGNPAPPPVVDAQPVMVECEASTTTPYVNQLVVYTFRFLYRVSLASPPNYEPAATTGFLREELGQTTAIVDRNGVKYNVSEVKTALFPTAPGKLTIGPTHLRCRLVPDFFDNSFSFMDPNRDLVTQPIELDVQPLPSQNRPPSFTGAVGTGFEMQANLNRDRIKAGEPVKLTMTVKGNCHPDLIMDPNLPNWQGVRLYACESQNLPFEKPDYRAGKTFKIPLVPQQGGSFNLSQLSWSYFDTSQRRYVTLTAQPMSLQVEGDVRPPQAGATPVAGEPISPLRPPLLSSDSPQGWAKSPAVAAVALLPWVLSLLVLTVDHAHQQLQQHLQTRQARLRRVERQVKSARSLEALSQLAYQGLSIRLGQPLHGLPFQHLRELLPAELVEQLEQVEAARYAPAADEAPERVEAFRRLLLAELGRSEP